MELLKLLSASQVLAQIISFIILFLILRIFLWERFLKVLDDRKERIASELKKIEESRSEAAALKADYESRLGEIDRIASARIEEAVLEGKRMAEEIKKDADAQANRAIEKGEETLRAEFSRAREELRDEIVDISISAAEKVIEDKLTEKGDRKIVKDFLNRLDKLP